MIELVTFEGVTFKHKKLIWQYNELTNSALLTFERENSQKPQDKNKIMQHLNEKYGDEIQCTKDKVEITNVQAFKIKSPMTPLQAPEKAEPVLTKKTSQATIKTKISRSPESGRREHYAANRGISVPNLTTSSSPASSPNFSRFKFSRKKSLVETTDREETPVMNKSTTFFKMPINEPKPSSELAKSLVTFADKPQDANNPDMNRKEYYSILLHDLILYPEDSGIWRETIGVMDKLDGISETKAQLVSTCLRSSYSFYYELQRAHTRELYPEKMKLMSLIEDLLALIQPIYSEWAKDKPLLLRKKLYLYLQNAIYATVQYKDLVPTHTDLERNPEMHAESFKNNQKRVHYAIYQINKSRAEMTLIDLRYLLDRKLTLDLVMPQPNETILSDIADAYFLLLKITNFSLNHAELPEQNIKNQSQVMATLDKIYLLRSLDPDLDQLIAQLTHIKTKKISRTKGLDLELQKDWFHKINSDLNFRFNQMAISSFQKQASDKLEVNPDMAYALKLQLDQVVEGIIRTIELTLKHTVISDRLTQSIENKNELMINGFYSFKLWLENHLKLKYAKTKSLRFYQTDLEQMASKICKDVILKLHQPGLPAELKKVAPLLPELSDMTFYLSTEWILQLDSVLNNVSDKKKFSDSYVQGVVQEIMNFIVENAKAVSINMEDKSINHVTPGFSPH